VADDVAQLKGRPDFVACLSRLPARYGVSRAAAFRRVSEVSDVSIVTRKWTAATGSLSGLYVSGRTGSAREVLAVKRWAERVVRPAQGVPPQLTGSSLVIAAQTFPQRRELVVAVHPCAEADA
jgi:hypothetical protein